MRSDIKVGGTFPDYELTDHTGKRRTLSELQGNYPMILVLSRGQFCPKDRRQLRNLVELYPELKVGYTRIVTVSTDNLIETNELRDGLGAQWPPRTRICARICASSSRAAGAMGGLSNGTRSSRGFRSSWKRITHWSVPGGNVRRERVRAFRRET